MKSLTISFCLWSLIVYCQTSDKYIPGKIVRINCSIMDDNGNTPTGFFSIQLYSGGNMIKGQQLNQTGIYTFDFCSNLITDSTIRISATHLYPQYYFGTLTTKFIPNKTYNLVVTHIKEKDNEQIYRTQCGSDIYNQFLIQKQDNYDNNVLYRHCDGTILSFRELLNQNKWTSEWTLIKQ